MELRRGDLIEVKWLDIFEDPVGNPDAASVATRLSIGYFWGLAESAGVTAFVTTTTIDNVDEGTNGYCCYPLSIIVSLKLVRKGRGKAYRATVPVLVRLVRPGIQAGVDPKADPDLHPPKATRVRGIKDGGGGVSEQSNPAPLD